MALNLFCFREKYFTYFGCIPISVALGLALFIAFGTQYYAIIFFLTQQVWYWFIALFVAVVAHSLLFWAIYSRKHVLFYPIMIYQALFILLLIATAVLMVVDLCDPPRSQIYKKCSQTPNPDCHHKTQVMSGINTGIFLLSALLNVFVLHVFWTFRMFIDASTRRPAVNVVSDQMTAAGTVTVNRPTYSDPTHNTIYSPGNAYQPQPLSPVPPPQQPPQQAHNPAYQPYPTVRGPTAPVYPSSQSSPLPQAYDTPPPAYSQAVADQKY